MPTDLYTDDLNAISDAELFKAIEDFIGVSVPQTERQQEGYLLDFKESWSDSALRTVAAFANTFGGLLIVGVSESSGRANQIVGAASSRSDIKTGIASAIASNISPTPPFEIRDLILPSSPGKHLCLVRVRKGNAVYYLTKKGEQPIYVRNEDQSIPADAARLQSLLATRFRHDVSVPTIPSDPPGFYISELNPASSPPQRKRSETFLQLQIIPEEHPSTRLDLAIEHQLQALVRSTYPKLGGARFSEARSRYWYQIGNLNELADHEMRWAIVDGASIVFMTQIRSTFAREKKNIPAWSLTDVMTNIDCTIELVHELWDYIEYRGEGRIFAALQVDGLSLLERSSGGIGALAFGYYDKDGPRKRASPLPTNALTKAATPGTRATAMTELTYATRSASHSEAVAILTNQLLRDLGHSTRLADLRALL